MKLKYSNNAFAINAVLIYCCFVIMLFMIVCCGSILGEAIQNRAAALSIALMSIGMILVVGFGLILVSVLNNFNNYKQRENMRAGEKIPGNIIEAHDTSISDKDHGYLTVSYHNGENVFYVNNVERNDAFELLKMLLNPFPVKSNIQVPITLYQNNHTIYADLDSVDFLAVPGYEECKKLVEQKYQGKQS